MPGSQIHSYEGVLLLMEGRKVVSKEVGCGILPDDCCLPTSSNPTMSKMLTAPATVSPARLKENQNKRGHNPLA